MRQSSHRKSISNWDLNSTVWFVVDGGLGFLAMHAAFFLSPSFHAITRAETATHIEVTSATLLFSVVTAISAHIFGLHDPLAPRQFWMTLTRCMGANWLAVALFSGIVFALLYNRVGRYILVQALFYTPILMALSRRVIWRYSTQRKRRLLLLGAKRTGQAVRSLVEQSSLPFQVVAFVDHNPELAGLRVDNYAVLDGHRKLSERCQGFDIDEIVACVGGQVADGTMSELMECLTLGVKVSHYSQFVERNFYQVPVENIRGEWFLYADIEVAHPFYSFIKRGTDIAAALIGGIVTTPVLLIAILLIKLESRGPAFYSQIRTGQFNVPFRILKLRTMRLDAETSGPQWASKSDSRVTRIGRILRMTRIDEIPQFWNILQGEMSLVGPRPERPEFVEKLDKIIPFFQQRHLVKPGLTGWAQINYPYGASVEDALKKLKYDLYYVKYASIGLDLQIILRTIGAVMKGAR